MNRNRTGALDVNLDDTDDFQTSRGHSFRIRKATVVPKKRRLGRRAKVDSSKCDTSSSKQESAKCRAGRRDRFVTTSASSSTEIELERDRRCSSGCTTSKESTSTESIIKYPKANSHFEDLKSGETTQSEDVTDTGTCVESEEEINVQPGKVVVEKLTGLSTEKSYVVKGQWILESQWLKDGPDTTTSESQSPDEWSEIVGTSETTDWATSDATVRASDLTSPESRDDWSDVDFKPCNDDAGDMEVDVQNDLVLAKKLAQREDEKLLEERMTDEAVAVCQVCQRDISHMNSQRRLQHVNKCLDQQIELEEQRQAEEAAARRLQNAVLACPICDAKFKQQQAKKNHMKACAKKKKVPPQELRVMLCKQEQEYLKKLVDGELPIVPEKTKKKKVAGKKKEPKVVKEPTNKYEEDMQMTLALSKSLVEFTAAPIKPAVPVVTQKTTKGKKNMGPQKVPLLVARGSEDRLRIIEDRVFALIPDETRPFPELVALKPSKLIEEDWDDTIQVVRGYLGGSLWAKCCTTSEDILKAYYVARLMPPISPCKVAMGSKIRRMSQVPGRKKSLASQAAVNLVEEASLETVDVAGQDSSHIFDEEGLLYVSERIQATGFCTGAKDDDSHHEAKPYDEISRSSHDNLILDFKKMIGNPQLSDVSILCKNVEYVPAHKFVFAARCPTLLEEIKRERIIEFVDVSKAAIVVFLTFLYTGEICDLEPHDVLCDVGDLSERFNLDVLTDECKRKGWTSAVSEATSAACDLTSAPRAVAMEIDDLLKSLWEDDDESESEDPTEDRENITMNEEDVEEIYEFMTQKKRSQKRTNESVEDHGIVDYNVYFDEPSEKRESLVHDNRSRQELVVDAGANAVDEGGRNVHNKRDALQVDREEVTSGGVTLKIIDATKTNLTPNANVRIPSSRVINVSIESDPACSGAGVDKTGTTVCSGTEIGTICNDGTGSDLVITQTVKTVQSDKETMKNGVSTVQVDEFLIEDHGSDIADNDSTDIEVDEDIWSFTEMSPSKPLIQSSVGSQLPADEVNPDVGSCGESDGDCRSVTCVSDSESVRDCDGKVDVQKVQLEIDRLLHDGLAEDRGDVAHFQDDDKKASKSLSRLSDTSDDEVLHVSGKRDLDACRRNVDKLKKSIEDLDRESIIELKKRLEEKCAVARSSSMELEKMGIVRRPSKGCFSEDDSTDDDCAMEPGAERNIKSTNDTRMLDGKDTVKELAQISEGCSTGGGEPGSVDLAVLVPEETRTASKRNERKEKAQTSTEVGKGLSSGSGELKSVDSADVVPEESRTTDCTSNHTEQEEKARALTNVGEGFSLGGDEPGSVDSADFFPNKNKRTVNSLSRPELKRLKRSIGSSKGYSSAGDSPRHKNLERTVAEKQKKSTSDSEELTKRSDFRVDDSSRRNKKLICNPGANSKLTEHVRLGIDKQKMSPLRNAAKSSSLSPKRKDSDRHVEIVGRQSRSPEDKITDSIKDGARVNKVDQFSATEKKGKSFRSMCSNMVIGSDGALKAQYASRKKMSCTALDKAGVGNDVNGKEAPETGKNLSPANRRLASDVKIRDKQIRDPSFALPRSPLKKVRRSSINDERISKKSPGLRNPGSPVVKLRKLSPRSLNLSGVSEISRRDSDVVRFTPGRELSDSWHQSSTPCTSTVRDYLKDDSLFLSPVCKDQRSTFQIITPQTNTPKKEIGIQTSTRLKSPKNLEKMDTELENSGIIKTQAPPTFDLDTPTQSFVEGVSSASLFDTSAPKKLTHSPRFEKVYHSPMSKLGDVKNYACLSDSDEEERTSFLSLAPHLIVAESPTAHVQSDVSLLDTAPSSPLFPAAPKLGYYKSPLKKSSPRKKSTSLFTLLDSPKVLSYNSLGQSPASPKGHLAPSPKKLYISPSAKEAHVLKRKRLQSYETDAGRLKRRRHDEAIEDGKGQNERAKSEGCRNIVLDNDLVKTMKESVDIQVNQKKTQCVNSENERTRGGGSDCESSVGYNLPRSEPDKTDQRLLSGYRDLSARAESHDSLSPVKERQMQDSVLRRKNLRAADRGDFSGGAKGTADDRKIRVEQPRGRREQGEDPWEYGNRSSKDGEDLEIIDIDSDIPESSTKHLIATDADRETGKLDRESREVMHIDPGKLDRDTGKLDRDTGKLDRESREVMHIDPGILDRDTGKLDRESREVMHIDPGKLDRDTGKLDRESREVDYNKGSGVLSTRTGSLGERSDRRQKKGAEEKGQSKKLSTPSREQKELLQEPRKGPIVVEILDSDEEEEADGVRPEDRSSRRVDDFPMTDGGKEEILREFEANRTRERRSKGKICESERGDFSRRSELFHDVSIPDACDDAFLSGQVSRGRHHSRGGAAFHDLSIPDAYDYDIRVPSPRFNRSRPTPRQNSKKSQSFRDDSAGARGHDSLSSRNSQPRPSLSRVMSPDMFDDDDDIVTGGPEITVLSDDSLDEEKYNEEMKTNEKSDKQPRGTEGHNDTLIALLDDGSFEEDPGVQEDARIKTPLTRRNWTAPSPFTPMPDYDNMRTPEVKEALGRIGVRPQGKKKAIKLLKHVYEETHQYETDPDYTPAGNAKQQQGVVVTEKIRRIVTFEKSDDGNSDQEDDRLFGDLEVPLLSRIGMGLKSICTRRGRDEVPVSRDTKRRAVHDMSDSESELDRSFANSSTSSETASDVSLTDDGDLTLSQQEDNKSLKEKVLMFIRRDNELYTMVLKYQPIEFTWLMNRLKDGAVPCPSSKLMDILDEQCIVFKAQRPARKAKKNRQRKTKKVMASSSPRKIPSPKKGPR